MTQNDLQNSPKDPPRPPQDPPKRLPGCSSEDPERRSQAQLQSRPIRPQEFPSTPQEPHEEGREEVLDQCLMVVKSFPLLQC